MKITVKRSQRLEHPPTQASIVLEDLLELEEGLSDWEIEFIESLDRLRGFAFSEKQISRLEEIWFEHCS